MKHLLFIIGDELVMNENFKTYIYRSYENKFKEIHELRFQSKTDKDLPFLLEKLVSKYDFITLFAGQNYYATLAKILATLSEDTLILKEGTLVPDKAFYQKDSFVCELNQTQINVIKASPTEKLPALLGDIKLNFAHFCLFGIDEESALILLETLTKSYEVTIKSIKLLENLTLIKAYSFGYGKVESFLQSVQTLFGQKVFLGKNPLEFIISKLLEKNLKISFAESCTGGLCASELTKISGVSAIFEGSIVSYSNRLKHEWLGISEGVLENDGEYSERCVYFMLKGIFKTAKPDFALALSGLADTSTKKLPEGTIYMGAMYKDGTYIQEVVRFQGDRQLVRKQAVLAAFCLLLKLKPEFFSRM